MQNDRIETFRAIINMNDKQFGLMSLAVRAIATLPPEQSKEFRDLVINDGMPIPEAAAKFGIGADEGEVR